MNFCHRIFSHSSQSLSNTKFADQGTSQDKKWYHSRLFCTIPVLTYLLFLLPPLHTAYAFKPFRIGTGGKTGVYYPIGKLLASGITLKAQDKSSAINDYIGAAQYSAGSIENTHGVIEGTIEAGLVQADIASFAYTGKKMFKNSEKASSLRAIASLYPEKFHIVVREDAGIMQFTDLIGKRIAVDEEGSGTLSVMRILLRAYNLQETDLSPVYLKPVFINEKMTKGKIQGFVMMAGTPMPAVNQLLKTGIRLIPVGVSVATEISRNYPYLCPGAISGDTYAGIDDIATLEVYALLVVNQTLPDKVAYAITQSLFDEKTTRLLRLGHPQGKSITLDTALNGISIPLHPGAQQFYREQNMLK